MWKLDKGLIQQWNVDGENIIHPWGIETADSSAFFSLDQSVGYRYQIISNEIKLQDNKQIQTLEVKMKEGYWRLVCEDELVENKIIRVAKLTCLEDTVLMDFVMRFRFLKKFFPGGEIADLLLTHKNTNIYNQFDTDNVTLSGEKFQVDVKIKNVKCAAGLAPMMYLRDYNDEWVIHARMFPKTWDREVIKMCNSYMGTRPLPKFLSNILLKSDVIKKALWHRGERSPYPNKIIRSLNPNAFALCVM